MAVKYPGRNGDHHDGRPVRASLVIVTITLCLQGTRPVPTKPRTPEPYARARIPGSTTKCCAALSTPAPLATIISVNTRLKAKSGIGLPDNDPLAITANNLVPLGSAKKQIRVTTPNF